jgi:hypothetical protein
VAEGDENKFVRVRLVHRRHQRAGGADNATAAKVVDDSSLSVSISGTVKEGSTVTATPTIGDSDDTGATVAYQWQIPATDRGWSGITGATSSTYALGEGDENKFVRVHAAFTDDTGVLLSADSGATANKVLDNSSLSIALSGFHHTGSTVTATPTLGDADDTGATVAYQWQRSTSDGT